METENQHFIAESETQITQPEQTEKRPDREIVSTPEKEHLIEVQYEDVIRTHAPVDSGKEGIIYRMESEEVPSQVKDVYAESGRPLEDDSALKVLKVYSLGKAKREYGFQLQAHSIVSEYLKSHPEDAGKYAKIPTPIDYRQIHIEAQTREQIARNGGSISGDKVEVLLMDFIEGRDLATDFYRWVLDHAPADKEYVVQNTNPDDFHQLQQGVAKVLEFVKPKGSGVSESEREAEQQQVNNLNAKKVYDFLHRTGYELDQSVIDQIVNTRKLLQKHGLYHNDEHERNFMFSGGQVYMIDFAKATQGPSDEPQLYIDQELQRFTKEHKAKLEGEKQRAVTESLDRIRHMADTVNFQDQYPSVYYAAAKGSMELYRHLVNRSHSSHGSISDLDKFFAMMVHFINKGQISRDQGRQIADIMEESLKPAIIKRGKVQGYRLSNPSAQRQIESYKELFAE